MFVLALTSAKGGVGRTTFAASLATVLAQRGVSVLVLELDPQNALSLHLGAVQAPANGLAAGVLNGINPLDAALCNADGVYCLPFGQLEPARLDAFRARVAREPAWLADLLANINMNANTVIVLDAPPLPSLLAVQAVRAADFTLSVILCDMASVLALDTCERYHAAVAGSGGFAHVLNQVNPTRPLRRKLALMLQQRLGKRLAAPVHQDESVSDALAQSMTVLQHAPFSQAAHDFQGLADWLLEHAQLPAGRMP